MRRKRTKADREWWSEFERRSEQTDRLLRRRIEHHRRILIEENPGWDHPKTDDEWRAWHERRIRERVEAHLRDA